MLFLMNKNNVVETFEIDNTAFTSDIAFKETEQYGTLPIGLKDITSWIEKRKALKYNLFQR